MNHSGIISTNRGQHGIQNVYVWVCVYVCVYERGLPQLWAGSSPCLVAPLPFFSVLLPAPAVFPRGNLICRLPRRCSRLSTSFPPPASSLFWVTESTHQLLALFVFQSTILTGVRNITVGSRRNRILFFFFFPTSSQQVWPYSPFSASTTVLSSPPLLPSSSSLLLCPCIPL